MIRSERGVSLVEVAVSLAVIAAMVPALAAGLVTATQAIVQSNVRAAAVILADSQMEDVEAAGYVAAPAAGAASYSPIWPPSNYQLATLDRTGAVVADSIIGVPWDTAGNAAYNGVNPPDPGVQKVTVIVLFSNREVYRLTDFKVNR